MLISNARFYKRVDSLILCLKAEQSQGTAQIGYNHSAFREIEFMEPFDCR